MRKATRQYIKDHNTRLVLNTIYHQGDISRADVARKTHLTRPTVSNIVAELIEKQLVEETGLGPSGGGKPPTLLDIHENAYQCICADLGSTEFRGAIVNLRGEIQHHLSLPIQNEDGEAALDLVYQLLDQLIKLANSPLIGVGIGTPGLIDAERCIVKKAVNLDWNDLPLGDLLEERYDLAAYIANDCQVAALGEFSFGDHETPGNLIVIKIGRGVGSGIVLNGQLHYGDDFGAGEIGHVVVSEGGERCACGNYGCLETTVSNRAILKRAQSLFVEDPQSILRQIVSSPQDIDMDVVLNAYEAGDGKLLELFDTVSDYLAIAIANIIGILNVHKIMIAGDFACTRPEFVEALNQKISARALPGLANATKTEATCLGKDIVILGAAAILLQSELGII